MTPDIHRGMKLLAEGYSEEEVLQILESAQIKALEEDAAVVDQAIQASLAKFKQMTQQLVDTLKTVSTNAETRRLQIKDLRDKVTLMQEGVRNLRPALQTATRELTELSAKYKEVRDNLRAAQVKASQPKPPPIPRGGFLHLFKRQQK